MNASSLMPRRAAVPAWTQSLNLAGPRLPTASWAWVLLLAGVTALAWVLPQWQQADEALAQAQADVQRLQRARHQLGVQAQAQTHMQSRAARPVRAGDAAQDTAEPILLNDSNAARAAQLMQWLGFPWLATLQQADEAAQAEHALMLGFNLDLSNLGAGPQALAWARMSAAVMDDAAALRWAQALGPQAQIMSRDKLGVPFDTARGPYAWRAEVSWPGAQP